MKIVKGHMKNMKEGIQGSIKDLVVQGIYHLTLKDQEDPLMVTKEMKGSQKSLPLLKQLYHLIDLKIKILKNLLMLLVLHNPICKFQI